MRETLRHRGPDDAGAWVADDATVGLPSRRLSILDLSEAGRQPMRDASGRFHIVFNGEIYNHADLRRELEGLGYRFRTTCDTEVLLAAYQQWSEACLERLDGMFAFAVHDLQRRRLFVARNRTGEKPLFYGSGPRGFVFASELKALLSDPDSPREIDVSALNHYLAYAFVPGERCILRGFHKLAPGQALTYALEDGDIRRWTYWRLPDPAEGPPRPFQDLVERLEGLLAQSVRRRLAADVPLGILLSGGLDSSIVTALAMRTSSRRVETFTVSFPGGLDEAPHARLVAQHFGTCHRELRTEPDADTDLLPQLARQFDEPMGDSSMVPTFLLSRLVRRHCVVALGGDGGDELFGGYHYYGWIQAVDRLRRRLPKPVRQAVSRAAHRLPMGTRGRQWLIGLDGSSSRSVAHIDLYFDAEARRRLLSRDALVRIEELEAPESEKSASCPAAASALRQAMVADFHRYLPEDVLVKVDRASMLASLEMRAPFLDHKVVEFAFRDVPDHLKVFGGERKVLLRAVGARLLPREFDLRRKQGFSLRLGTWLRGPWWPVVNDVLEQADPMLFDRPCLKGLLEGQRRGRDNGKRLFALTLLELWRRCYRISL